MSSRDTHDVTQQLAAQAAAGRAKRALELYKEFLPSIESDLMRAIAETVPDEQAEHAALEVGRSGFIRPKKQKRHEAEENQTPRQKWIVDVVQYYKDTFVNSIESDYVYNIAASLTDEQIRGAVVKYAAEYDRRAASPGPDSPKPNDGPNSMSAAVALDPAGGPSQTVRGPDYNSKGHIIAPTDAAKRDADDRCREHHRAAPRAIGAPDRK